MLTARFDGGCIKNPGGHAACACVIEQDGIEVYRESRYLGHGPNQSNNVAEFEGMRMILKWYLDKGITVPMEVIGDSQIAIWRMLGKYRKPVNGLCAESAKSCLEMKNWIMPGRVTFRWERREHNDLCDSLCDALIAKAQGETK